MSNEGEQSADAEAPQPEQKPWVQPEYDPTRVAVIDANGKVVNKVVGPERADPAFDGLTLVELSEQKDSPIRDCNIGDIWDGKKFTAPETAKK